MSNSQKTSQFTKLTTINDSTDITLVDNGQNFTISFADFKTALGVTGTLTAIGDGTPVLNVPVPEDYQIRDIESGAGVIASTSPNDGVQLDWNVTQDAVGVPITSGLTNPTPVMSSLIEGAGISIVKAADGITFSITQSESPGIVFIFELSDFPVQDANTITLQEQVLYLVVEAFTTSKNFIVEDGAVFSSISTLGPLVTYTGTNPMFSGTDVDFIIRDIRITHPNAEGYNFTDTVGGTKVFLSSSVRALQGTKYGTFNDYQTYLITIGAAFDMDDGITFTGTNTLINSIDKLFIGSTSATFKAIDLGSSIAQTTEFRDLTSNAPVGAFGISGVASSGNIPVGRLAMVNNCEFGGGITPLENITNEDVRWNFTDNTPIPDSVDEADLYLTGGAETITTGSAGDWQEIGVPGAGGVTWASDISSRFTVGTDGVITYIGERTVRLRVSGRATVSKVGGGANIIEVRLAKNWDGTVSDSGIEKSRAQTQSTDPTSVPIGSLVEFTNGDNLRAIFSNIDGTSNIVANVSALEIA